jgi:hypothetical protein
VFDSKAELKRWYELRLLERAGEIKHLDRQYTFSMAYDGRPVKIRSKGFPNGRPCFYTVDFTYFTAAGVAIYEEYKAWDTEVSRLRRAVIEAMYNIEITVTGPASKSTPKRIASEAAQ